MGLITICSDAMVGLHPIPQPLTPAGARGAFNSRFVLFSPDTGKLQRGRGAPLHSPIDVRCGRSQWLPHVRAGARSTARLSFAVHLTQLKAHIQC